MTRKSDYYMNLQDLARKVSEGETIVFEGQAYDMVKVTPNFPCKDCTMYDECNVGLSLICMLVDDILYDRATSGNSEFAKCRLKKYHRTPNK